MNQPTNDNMNVSSFTNILLSQTQPSTPPIHTYNQELFGNPILQKSNTALRILLQNPNGISYEDECFEFKLYLEQMKSLQVDVIALSETNINWRDYSVYKHTTHHWKTTFIHSQHIPSSSTRTFNTPYQPGGCSITLCEHPTGRYHSSYSDPLSGWSVVHLNTSTSTPVTHICV